MISFLYINVKLDQFKNTFEFVIIIPFLDKFITYSLLFNKLPTWLRICENYCVTLYRFSYRSI